MSAIEFSKRLNHFQSFLYHFALRLTQNSENAKDLVQETALRAFRYKDKFQIGTNFKGWIATIMRNIFINQYRKRSKRKTVNKPVEDFAFALEGKIITPNQGESNLQMEELKALFEQIDEKYQIPFWMHFQGFEYQEIAEEFNIPIGTVKSRIFTARQKMKRIIANRWV